MLPIADLVQPLMEDELLRVTAACHEIAARAVRNGAPLAAYSLHRRSLKKYARATEEKSIASPVCFVCACTFSWVKGRRGNQVSWVKPFKAATENPEVISHFGAWSMEEVSWRFSVNAYLSEYRHEPGNDALDLVGSEHTIVLSGRNN